MMWTCVARGKRVLHDYCCQHASIKEAEQHLARLARLRENRGKSIVIEPVQLIADSTELDLDEFGPDPCDAYNEDYDKGFADALTTERVRRLIEAVTRVLLAADADIYVDPKLCPDEYRSVLKLLAALGELDRAARALER